MLAEAALSPRHLAPLEPGRGGRDSLLMFSEGTGHLDFRFLGSRIE